MLLSPSSLNGGDFEHLLFFVTRFAADDDFVVSAHGFDWFSVSRDVPSNEANQ